tara:strand:+ start:284 stop:673 length:390 start_codon:yes stop_codon:yes gene_type:complete
MAIKKIPLTRQPFWTRTQEVCIATGISKSRLMEMKASGELIAGKHWVYLTGKRSAPIGWDLDEIRDWQIQQTKLANKKLRIKGISQTFEGKFRARIYKDKKEINCGTFTTREEAIQAQKQKKLDLQKNA